MYKDSDTSRFFTTPEVFLIGATAPSRPEIMRYLKRVGAEEFFDEIHEADVQGLDSSEWMLSLIAKLCYASLKVGMNANVTKVRRIEDNLKTGVLGSGHGSVLEHCQLNFIVTDTSRVMTHELVRHRAGTAFCLAGDTEVYSGSKLNGRFDGVRKSWTMKQLYEWSLDPKRKGRIKLIKVRCFDGKRFVPARIKNVVQSGHKQIFRVTLADGKAVRCSEDHRFLTPDGWKPVREMVVGEPLGTNGRKEFVFDQADLNERYNQKGETLRQIASSYGCSSHTVRAWLRKFGLQKPVGYGSPGIAPPNKGKRYTLNYKHSDEIKARLSESKRGSKNPQWKGDNASAQAGRLRAIRWFPTKPCEACGVQEGHRHHRDRNTLNNVESNIEFLCASCHGKRHYAEDGSPTWLTVKWVAIASIEAEGIEQTYDLEIDHPSHNFVANGLVTHNSQTSGRYCRIDKLKIIKDPLLDDCEDILAEVLSQIEMAVYRMECRKGLRVPPTSFLDVDPLEWVRSDDPMLKWVPNDKMPFDKKKKITSAIRRIAPNGIANEIAFSCNIRSLRHIFRLRTDPAAEWEIRFIFDQVWKLVKDRFACLFSDAVVTEVDGLVHVGGMKIQPWEKV